MTKSVCNVVTQAQLDLMVAEIQFKGDWLGSRNLAVGDGSVDSYYVKGQGRWYAIRYGDGQVSYLTNGVDVWATRKIY